MKIRVKGLNQQYKANAETQTTSAAKGFAGGRACARIPIPPGRRRWPT
jgi:hypothetical protein